LMLETYNLKKQLETTRESLSQALYQTDASSRVIARLVRERDAAHKELEQLRQAVGRGGTLRMDLDNALPGLDAEARNRISIASQQLSAERKERPVSPSLASPEQIKEWTTVYDFPPHKVTQPGVLCVDIHPTQQHLFLTGGVDKTAIVFNKNTGRKEATLVGHSKKVSQAIFHPAEDLYITGSQDYSVKVWKKDGDAECKAVHNFTIHTGDIVGVDIHKGTGHYVATASQDRTWAFHNIETGKTLLQVTEPDESPLTCLMLHPDGLILATGTEGNLVRIWDLKSQKTVATFRGHKDILTSLAFSENGYYLSTAARDNLIKLWDLRGPKNVHTLKLDSKVVALDYDYSGKYLAAATGNEVRIFSGKSLEHVKTLADHAEVVTGVKFGNDAQFLASTSMDRKLRIWGSH